MQMQEAVASASTFIKNASEIAARDPINAETLYMWDNQVTAIENFLAETEDFETQNPALAPQRKELFQLKKTIEGKVLAFELKQENQEVPPEPTPEEVLADQVEFGKEIQRMIREIGLAEPKSWKDLQELEEPRQMINNFIVETESLKGKNKALDAQRNVAKKFKKALDEKVKQVQKALESQEKDDEED